MLRVAELIITEALGSENRDRSRGAVSPKPQRLGQSPRQAPERGTEGIPTDTGSPRAARKVQASRRGGKVEIRFRGGEELEGIIALLISPAHLNNEPLKPTKSKKLLVWV